MSFNKSTFPTFILSILLTTALSVCAYALKVGSLEFEERLTIGPREFVLSGAGLKKFLSIQVVAVGLYLEKGTDARDALKDVPKRLEVVYLQNIPDLELKRATTKGIRKNVTKEEFEILKPKIDELNSYYPDVKKGDRIIMTYIPEQGLEMAVNDQVRIVIQDKDFARAFFEIWIGKVPVDPRMKKVLLGDIKGNVEID